MGPTLEMDLCSTLFERTCTLCVLSGELTWALSIVGSFCRLSSPGSSAAYQGDKLASV